MKLIDKYIMSRLFVVFFFMLVASTASIEMIHFVNMMEYFKNASLSAGSIISYYISYTPYMLNFLTPITSFMTTVLVTILLAGNSEIIAILSAGIPFKRLILPYMLFAVIIALLSFLFCGWIIPIANRHRVLFEISYLTRKGYHNMKDIHLKVDENKYIYVQSYNAYTGKGKNFTIESIEGSLKGKFFSEEIRWIPSKRVWQAKNWHTRKIDGLKETLKQGDKMDLTLNLEPADLGGSITIKDMVNMKELDLYIEKLKAKSSDSLYLFLVEKYTRYMYPFSVFILVLVGMLFASKKMRGGVIWQTIVSFILAILYLGMFMFASSRAESYNRHILLTIWTPNIIFGALVGFIYKFMPK